MSDEDRMLLLRRASEGDDAAAAKLERDHMRRGESVVSFLETLIGKLTYIEGIRINYRGVLKRIIKNGDGTPAGLIFETLQRVSYFVRTGPEANYTYTHNKERFVPWDVVHDIGEEGFMEGAWSAVR